MWIGKDGKIYNDPGEVIRADNLWDQQEKQNELLKKQNELLEQQRIDEERRKLEKQQEELERLERDRQQKNYIQQQRILALFDEIGIHQKQFIIFHDYLFEAKETKELETLYDKQQDIGNDIYHINYILENKFENIDKYDTNYDVIKACIDECYSQERKEKIAEIINSFDVEKIKILIEKRPFSSRTKEIYQNYSNFSEGIKIYLLFLLLLFFITVVLIILGLEGEFVPIIMAIIFGIIDFLVLHSMCNDYSNKNKQKENLINNLNRDLQDHKLISVNKKKMIKLLQEKEKTLNKKYEKINKQISDLEEKNQQQLEMKWKKFVDFRKSHYNSQIEKFLLDLGMDNEIETMGIQYTTISSKNKKNDGTIQDYIDYFCSFG